MKKMGLDPNEFGMGGGGGYADPELAALDAEIRRRGKILGSASSQWSHDILMSRF